VSDVDFNSPPYTGGLAVTACPAIGAPLAAATNTKRITVVVTPAQKEGDAAVVQAFVTASGP
jgi:hypothetical protein